MHMYGFASRYYRRVRELGPKDALRRLRSRISQLSYRSRERAIYLWGMARRRKLSWARLDHEFLELFLDRSKTQEERYSALFSYLVSGFLHYGSPHYARVYYPGASSVNGAVVDALEGFSRILPMIGAWIQSGRSAVIRDFSGRPTDLITVTRTGLLAGTDPGSSQYWGEIGDYDQRIVEAADIALSLWLLRDHVWLHLDAHERELIATWLLTANRKRIHNNNYHLFPVVINEVLNALDCRCDRELSKAHYEVLKSFAMGNGWFADGPNGEVDFYSAWAIQYFLFWLDRVNPGFDPVYIADSLHDFVEGYKYLMSCHGVPIFGRSVCYRMAVPAPLVAAASGGHHSISPGMARRALDAIWSYFVAKGALKQGRITQGYWQEDLDLLDNYSGPGSSLWCTRSLTTAFYNPPESDFWTAPEEALPIERGSFVVSIPRIRWEIRGSMSSQEIQILKRSHTSWLPKCEDDPSPIDRFLARHLRLPYRHLDKYRAYGLETYSSHTPFWLRH